MECVRCHKPIDERFQAFGVCTQCAIREHVAAHGGESRAEWGERVEARRLARLEELRDQAKREREQG